MKLIQINTVCNGSTGKIMCDIQRKANENGMETISFYGRRKGVKGLRSEKFGGFFSFWLHVVITTVFDRQGYGSYFKTKKLVKRLKEENADIIHLHNIHGYYLNLPLLFDYLNHEYNGKIFWSFHDCWPFTGHCPHFILKNCFKWKTMCYRCPNKKIYPTSLFFDNSKRNYINKKNMFTSLKNLTIVTPSDWLNNFVSQSFFKNHRIITVNNGIDLTLFKPTYDENIKNKYNIPTNKKIVLGVANLWEERKGLNQFIEIANTISEEYIVVLVGLKKNQIKKLNKKIVGIERTNNISDLIKIYSVADVFINPSREETFSLVTIESLACHTPIIVPKNTPMESFVTPYNGIAYSDQIKLDDIYLLSQNKNLNFDIVKNYDKENMTNQIIQLYKGV